MEADYGEDPEVLKELLKLQRQTQRAVRNEARALQALSLIHILREITIL